VPLVRDVLAKKGGDVASVSPSATVRDAATLMQERHIGAVMVVEGGEILGIFTERDVLYRVVAGRKDPDKTLVKDVMTAKVAFCTRDTLLEGCRAIMTRHKLRHLPVVEDGRLVGMISSGDILARELQDHEETIRYLHEYMHGAR
jgi:CBS domain-containing protein